MVIFNHSMELKVFVLTDKVKRCFHEVGSRAISFKEDGSVERRHKYFADTSRNCFAASSKAVATLIWPVWFCRETFNMYL